jgi:hypothetical protein
VLDYIFVLDEKGIRYLDEDGVIKPTNITTGGFTWAKVAGGGESCIYFGGAENAGLWYSNFSDPYNIMQTILTTGTFYDYTNNGTYGFAIINQAYIHFLTSNGAYYKLENTNFTQTPGYTDIDFKHGIADTNLFFGGTNEGIYNLKNPTNVTEGNFYASFVLSSVNGAHIVIIFGGRGGSAGVWRGTRNGTSFTLLSSVHAYHAAKSSSDITYLCTDAGIKYYTGDGFADTNITSGTFYYAMLGDDGFMYFCGEDGIYFLDYDGEIKFTGKSGSYVESIQSPDNRMYFVTSGGGIIRSSNNNRGNTGYSVASKMKLIKTKFSKEIQSVEYSVLNDVSPQISREVLKRMSKSELDLRFESLLNNIAMPPGLTFDDEYYKADPVSCEVGNFGFKSAIIALHAAQTGKGGMKAWAGLLNEWYSDLRIAYIDNISLWRENSVKIICTTYYLPTVIIALINYPPEEWDENNLAQCRNIAMQKASVASHRIFVSPGSEIDISSIYEDENSRTMVVYSPSDHIAAGVQGVKFVINGEILSYSLFRFFSITWSERVCQTSGGSNTGNAIAKTLTCTQAVLQRTVTLSILDAFGDCPAITEEQYKAMSDAEINDRATALTVLATGNRYKKNNEVIEVNTIMCPVT